MAARLTILGVFRPVISAETWREQWQVTANDDATREHFRGLVLIEAIVEGLAEPIDFGKFGQTQPHTQNPHSMQVGYDEALLSADGEVLIQRQMNCVRGTGTLSFAVYIHFYDPSKTLLWQCGQVTCPPIHDVPARLAMLVPYNACT